MKAKLLVVPLFALAILGCVSPEQRAERAAALQAQREAQAEQFLAAVRQRCSAYGFREGSDAYAGCVQNEVRASEVAQRAQAQQRQQKAAQSSQDINRYLCMAGNHQACANSGAAPAYQQGTHLL